jgi:tetratricopeptide (TPR) repeat protein
MHVIADQVGALRGNVLHRIVTYLMCLSLLGVGAASAQTDDRKLCNEGRGAPAIAACDRAIASGEFKDDQLAQIYMNRGVERKGAGDLDGAIADYDASIKLQPNNALAFNNRANAVRDKGDLDRAIADYTEALRIDPGYTAAYVNRGMVHERKGDVARARADYEEAIARPPKYGNGRGGQEMARRRLAGLPPKP